MEYRVSGYLTRERHPELLAQVGAACNTEYMISETYISTPRSLAYKISISRSSTSCNNNPNGSKTYANQSINNPISILWKVYTRPSALFRAVYMHTHKLVIFEDSTKGTSFLFW